MLQVLIVHGETPGEPRAHAATEAGAGLDVLTHHQHGVVQHALGALRHGVHPDHKDDINDALETKREIRLIIIKM